jgi:hypothetical protein
MYHEPNHNRSAMDQYAAFRSQVGSPLVTMSPHTQVCSFAPATRRTGGRARSPAVAGEGTASGAPAWRALGDCFDLPNVSAKDSCACLFLQAAPGQQDGGGGGQLSEEGSASLGAVLHKSDDLQKRLRALLQETDEFFKPEDTEAAYAGSAPATSQMPVGEQHWQPVTTDSFEGTDWGPEQVVVARVNAAPMRRSYHQRPTLEAVREVCLPSLFRPTLTIMLGSDQFLPQGLCEDGTPSPPSRSPVLPVHRQIALHPFQQLPMYSPLSIALSPQVSSLC